MNKKMNMIGKTVIYLILLLIVAITIFPIFSVIMSSFKSNMEIMSMPERIIPREWTFDNYYQAINSGSFQMGRMLFNSLWFSAIRVAVSVVTASMCGYVFARGEFRGKKAIFAVFSSLMFISMGSITIYPTLNLLAKLGLSDSLWGLIVLHTFGIPIVDMYLVRGFINSLPKELDEAATIDGCSFIGIMFKIIMPLLKPVLATIAVLSFNGSWNDYVMPSIFTMTRPEQQTLIVGIMALKNSSRSAASWNLLFAATTLAIVPVMIIFVFCNKFITQGIVAGAVKG